MLSARTRYACGAVSATGPRDSSSGMSTTKVDPTASRGSSPNGDPSTSPGAGQRNLARRAPVQAVHLVGEHRADRRQAGREHNLERVALYLARLAPVEMPGFVGAGGAGGGGGGRAAVMAAGRQAAATVSAANCERGPGLLRGRPSVGRVALARPPRHVNLAEGRTAAQAVRGRSWFRNYQEALFGDILLASAAMDRLLYHCHVVVLNGQSFRTGKRAA